MKVFISVTSAIIIFLAVILCFKVIGASLGIELFIDYGEPITVTIGKASWESSGSISYLGYIASYVAILLSILTYNFVYYRGFSWFTVSVKYLVWYLSLAVLAVLIPMQMLVVMFANFYKISPVTFSMLEVGCLLGLMCLSWKFFYYRYLEKKSISSGYKLWACTMDSEQCQDYFYIIESKSKQDAEKYAQDYLGLGENFEIFKCDYKGSAPRRCTTTHIASFVEKREIKLNV